MGKVTRFLSQASVLKKITGNKTFAGIDLAGQLAGQYDDQYQPADVPAAPPIDTQPASLEAKDRIRRQAKRAQGVQSTIRSTATDLYSPQPKSLLGA